MRRQQNVGTLERWIRVVGGGLAAVAGLILLISPPSVVIGAAAVVLILLGLDFVYTGFTGYCPLYRRLGWSTARAHAPTSV